MTGPVVVMPDAVLVARTWLLTIAQLTALVGSRIYTRSPSAPVYPYVTIQRLGGVVTVHHRLDAAYLQYEAWGADETSASNTAATLRAALLAMEGFSTADATVTAVVEALGLGWVPDTVPTPPTPRFLGAVTVYLHPLP